MNFCRGQGDIGDTKCWLFSELNEHQTQISRQQLRKISKINHKELLSTHLFCKKQASLVDKSNYAHQSKEKYKLSLSKVSGKRLSNNRENISQKYQNNSKSTTYTSAPKQNFPLTNPPTPLSTTISISHPIQKHQINNNTISHKNSPISYINSNVHYNSNNSDKIKICQLQRNLQICTPKPFQLMQISKNQKYDHQISFPTSINPSKIRSMICARLKPQHQSIQTPVMDINTNQHPKNIKMQDNINTNNSILLKTVPTIVITMPTQLILNKSQTQSTVSNSIQVPSKQKIEQSIQNSNILTNTLSQYLSPDLGKHHLRTTHSIYSQQILDKKQIQQSVILVDFFHLNSSAQNQDINHNHFQLLR